ncbi:MAG: hypothetical protein ACXU9O_03360 [Gemmatimonadaceae bacterium]
MKLNSPHPVVTKVLTGIQGFDEITDGGLTSIASSLSWHRSKRTE